MHGGSRVVRHFAARAWWGDAAGGPAGAPTPTRPPTSVDVAGADSNGSITGSRRRGDWSLREDAGARDELPIVPDGVFVADENAPTATELVELARRKEEIGTEGMGRGDGLVAPMRFAEQCPARGDGAPKGIEKSPFEKVDDDDTKRLLKCIKNRTGERFWEKQLDFLGQYYKFREQAE